MIFFLRLPTNFYLCLDFVSPHTKERYKEIRMKKRIYQAPEVELLTFEVEQGFQMSVTPGSGSNIGDYGDGDGSDSSDYL